MKIDMENTDKIKLIKLLVLDVDGVMTDGSVWLDQSGKEIKRFDVQDGSGIKYLIRSGIDVAMISGRASEASHARARELGIKECLPGCRKKLPEYMSLLQKLGIDEEATACMGDDLTDLPLFNHCGFKIAPLNAVKEIRERADLVTENAGGHGAVREAAEIILRVQGRWQSLLEEYLET
ncbi:HAD-IIIA family hydrolase [Candidatus Sumerlaeota bacterium]|nr:HAD-IIIA family hydrolase [Candidatus Sumerlaeota bacterium]